MLLQTAVKPAPQATTPHILPISDIIPKVETIVTYRGPLVNVPIFIQTALRRAIVTQKAMNS